MNNALGYFLPTGTGHLPLKMPPGGGAFATICIPLNSNARGVPVHPPGEAKDMCIRVCFRKVGQLFWVNGFLGLLLENIYIFGYLDIIYMGLTFAIIRYLGYQIGLQLFVWDRYTLNFNILSIWVHYFHLNFLYGSYSKYLNIFMECTSKMPVTDPRQSAMLVPPPFPRQNPWKNPDF